MKVCELFILCGVAIFSITNAHAQLASNNTVCPSPAASNQLLNALLLQLLLSAGSPALQQQQQQVQQPLFQAATRLEPQTTVITSSIVQTVTELLATEVPLWFRNARITTTIVSTTVREVTQLVTLTSTLTPTLNPDLNVVRTRRNAHLELEPSMDFDLQDVLNDETQPLVTENSSIDNVQIDSIVKKPEVQKAWNDLVDILNEAIRQ